jgi:uncharacterized protein (TIGR03435 family)
LRDEEKVAMDGMRRELWGRALGSTLAICAFCTIQVAGQEKVSEAKAVNLPTYDVVSIKPNKTGSGNVSVSIDDGNFDAVNVSLKNLILSAYGLKEGQLENLPGWGETERFDIQAKIVEPDKKLLESLSEDQFREMRQPILTDRFALTFHHEKKVLAIYELVVVKGGPKFQATTEVEEKSDKGVNGVRVGGISVHNTQLTATGVPLSSVADTLSGQLHRIVVDKTGLVGKYNLMLRWTPEDAPANGDASAPTIFTAIQEQLGLKLRPGKEEVEALVIDHVAQPTEN